jgi:hypothetical protein
MGGDALDATRLELGAHGELVGRGGRFQPRSRLGGVGYHLRLSKKKTTISHRLQLSPSSHVTPVTASSWSPGFPAGALMYMIKTCCDRCDTETMACFEPFGVTQYPSHVPKCRRDSVHNCGDFDRRWRLTIQIVWPQWVP